MTKKPKDSHFIDLFASDMWALGVTLYQLVYFKYPFPDTNQREYKNAVSNTFYQSKNDSFFENLIYSLLQKDPHTWLTSHQLLELLGGCDDNRFKSNEAVMINSPFLIQEFPEDTLGVYGEGVLERLREMKKCLPIKL